MKKLIYLFAFLSLTLTFCKKQETTLPPVSQSIDNVYIPAGFDWKMTSSFTLHVQGQASTIITVSTSDGQQQLYKGIIAAGKTSSDIQLSLPKYMDKILVNGTPVMVTGNDLTVTLSGMKELLLTNYTLAFDGVSDYVNLGDISELNNVVSFTVEGWANQTVNTDNEDIFSKYFDNDNDILLRTAGGVMYVEVGNGLDAYGSWANYSATITSGTWFHWAVVYDGSGGTDADRLKLFIDGNPVEIALSFTGTVPATTSSSLSGVNALLSSATSPFEGSMDEVRIWSTARSGAQIAANYNKIIDGSTANLVACWRMDEGSGTSLGDETTNSYTGTLNGCTWSLFSNSWDSDADGVNDLTDDYPLDAIRAFNNYTPVSGTGTLAFEDLWPYWGDYDFNDLILDYRFMTVTNASNEVVEIFGTFKVRANGAKMHNGFGFELPDAVAGILSNVVVTGYSHTQGILTIDGTSHFETAQTNPVVIAFDDTWDLMPGINNTVPGGSAAPFDSVVITMTVSGGGPFLATDFSLSTWNPFLFIDLDRGREVHLINAEPTDLMNLSYLTTGDDASNPGSNLYFQTATGFPWGMDFPIEYEYTAEYRDPAIAYLHFIEWIQSGGVTYTDWYSNTDPGYRNTTYIYAP